MHEAATTMTVAAVQASPVFLDKNRTVEKACRLIEEAGKGGAHLAVFPEVFVPGYPDWVWTVPNGRSSPLDELYCKLLGNSVAVPDEETEKLCRSAAKARVNVIIGLNERNVERSGSSIYNTLLFIDEKGRIAGKHGKLLPTGGERSIWAQGGGSTLGCFDTPYCRIGALICWENYMPLARQAIYDMGAQILAAPTWDKSESWLMSLRHIAREGGLFVIGCCMVLRMSDVPDSYEFKKLYPDEREWINVGNSCIVDPSGRFVAGPIAEREEILFADLDLSRIASARRMFDPAGHYARRDVFRFEVRREPE